MQLRLIAHTPHTPQAIARAAQAVAHTAQPIARAAQARAHTARATAVWLVCSSGYTIARAAQAIASHACNSGYSPCSSQAIARAALKL